MEVPRERVAITRMYCCKDNMFTVCSVPTAVIGSEDRARMMTRAADLDSLGSQLEAALRNEDDCESEDSFDQPEGFDTIALRVFQVVC